MLTADRRGLSVFEVDPLPGAEPCAGLGLPAPETAVAVPLPAFEPLCAARAMRDAVVFFSDPFLDQSFEAQGHHAVRSHLHRLAGPVADAITDLAVALEYMGTPGNELVCSFSFDDAKEAFLHKWQPRRPDWPQGLHAPPPAEVEVYLLTMGSVLQDFFNGAGGTRGGFVNADDIRTRFEARWAELQALLEANPLRRLPAGGVPFPIDGHT